MATQITLRRDTYANWTSVNPVLAEGEIGLVTNFADNNTRIKIGDGATAWNSLSYFTTSQDLSGYVTDAELASALSNYVPTSRTVNGKALSSNISIDKTDVGLGSVDNTSDANKPISAATQTALADKQDKAIVVSSNTIAVNDAVYYNVATATYTDPSPVEGKGFTVFVRNGTATVGGTAYATGKKIIRTYHSGSWLNDVFTIDSVGTITPVNTAITNNITVNELANRTQGQINNLVPQARTLTINSTAYDLSADRSWTVGDVTTNSAASLTSLTITGTAGAGFLSLINQSSAPSAVNGTVKLFANSSSNLTWVRRNNANSADIRRTLIMPDQDIDYTFPTPNTGSSSTLAGLSTVQTWTQQQTFSGTHRMGALQILDNDGTTWRTVLGSFLNNSLYVGSGFNILYTPQQVDNSSGSLVLGSNTAGTSLRSANTATAGGGIGITIQTGNQTSATASTYSPFINIITGNITNASALSSQFSSSVKFDVGTVTGAALRGGMVFFNSVLEPIWNGLQRGIFIGNATAEPTANSSGGAYLWVNSGRIKIRETDTGSNNFIVHAVAATKTTAGAPYTNDGYVTVIINGTAVKLMTTA